MVDDYGFLPSRKDMKIGKKAVDNGNWNVSVLKIFALNSRNKVHNVRYDWHEPDDNTELNRFSKLGTDHH